MTDPTADRNFRAMGTDCHIMVTASNPQAADILIDLAVGRVELLEDCWSRFRPNSELNRLNARAGHGAVTVSGDLFALVEAMITAWESTGGLFDPTILTSLLTLGYDADFALVLARSAIAAATAVDVQSAPGMSGVIINKKERTITLPTGVHLDPGAIGKVLAADIITDEIRQAGAESVLVNLGGDIVVSGTPLSGQWVIAVEDERIPSHEEGRISHWLSFAPGTELAGIATSTVLKRRWAAGRHHVIDPRTGDVWRGDLVQVTVAGPSGAQAETAATAALLLGSTAAQAWLNERGYTSLLMTADSLSVLEKESPTVQKIQANNALHLIGASHG